MNTKILHTCCFIGHRKINETNELRKRLYDKIEKLILKNNVDTFLFGSKSQFNDLCHETVTTLKEKYPHIKRIYVRSAYQHINESYKNYLLKSFEDTYYPKHLEHAGRASYVGRNYEIIDKSKFCIFYYDANYFLPKSGTKVAFDYAIRKNKEVINIKKTDVH